MEQCNSPNFVHFKITFCYVLSTSTGDGDVVIKAQVLAGGRGMGKFSNGFQGGVHLVSRFKYCTRNASDLPV